LEGEVVSGNTAFRLVLSEESKEAHKVCWDSLVLGVLGKPKTGDITDKVEIYRAVEIPFSSELHLFTEVIRKTYILNYPILSSSSSNHFLTSKIS
jgi:hypothetical protein